MACRGNGQHAPVRLAARAERRRRHSGPTATDTMNLGPVRVEDTSGTLGWSGMQAIGLLLANVLPTLPPAADPAVPPPSSAHFQPYPGAEFFSPGRRSPIIAVMHDRLVAVGCDRYTITVDKDVWGGGDIASLSGMAVGPARRAGTFCRYRRSREPRLSLFPVHGRFEPSRRLVSVWCGRVVVRPARFLSMSPGTEPSAPPHSPGNWLRQGVLQHRLGRPPGNLPRRRPQLLLDRGTRQRSASASPPRPAHPAPPAGSAPTRHTTVDSSPTRSGRRPRTCSSRADHRGMGGRLRDPLRRRRHDPPGGHGRRHPQNPLQRTTEDRSHTRPHSHRRQPAPT